MASGSLVVAASGNDGDRGNQIGYPAAFPHVTTVAATDCASGIAVFSSRSPYVDLAAPGSDILVASAIGKNWRASSGTSFSSLLVAGAAAWCGRRGRSSTPARSRKSSAARRATSHRPGATRPPASGC